MRLHPVITNLKNTNDFAYILQLISSKLLDIEKGELLLEDIQEALIKYCCWSLVKFIYSKFYYFLSIFRWISFFIWKNWIHPIYHTFKCRKSWLPEPILRNCIFYFKSPHFPYKVSSNLEFMRNIYCSMQNLGIFGRVRTTQIIDNKNSQQCFLFRLNCLK